MSAPLLARRHALAAVLCVGLASSAPALAQPVVPRPGDERPELPSFEGAARSRVLPPVPPPLEESVQPEADDGIVVKRFRVTGSSVFSEAELAALLGGYVGRRLGAEDLAAIQRSLTQHYVERGYVSSGAVIPSQQIRDGTLEIHIVEGRLVQVQIEGSRRFRESYLRDRIEAGIGTPLNVNDLELQLQLLQRDPRIESVQAELQPSAVPGEARLRLRVREGRQFGLGFEFGNFKPPSVGSYVGESRLSFSNILGVGDEVGMRLQFAEGLQRIDAHYELPVWRYGTLLRLVGRWSDSQIVLSPFDALDVESRAYTIGFSLRHPVYRGLRDDVWLGVSGEYRRSETSLLGRPISFVPGPENGVAKLAILRLTGEWLHRDLDQVLAFRSMLSIGLDALGATTNPGDIPDGRYVAWLGQLQWARRLPWLGLETVLRTDAQLASDPLLSLEQFAIGGRHTVRGYRENLFVRDQAVVSSAELRIPLWRDAEARHFVQLVPFADFGHSWNRSRPTFERKTLGSVGVGLRAQLPFGLAARFSWAHGVVDVDTPNDDDPQDSGIHFSVEWQAF